MEVRWDVLLSILGAALVTFLPRVVPLMVLSRLQLSDWFMRWLSYVPISVMAALVGQAIFIPNGKISFANNVELWAALPTFITAIWTRSILATVLTGVITVMVLRFLFQAS